jgi:hypothetical protein
MTDEEANKYLCQKLGIPWHEAVAALPDGKKRCSCGKDYWLSCVFNPDFSDGAGAVQLLRLMMEKGCWVEFYWHFLRDKYTTSYESFSVITTPGALLDTCVKWFKEGEK